MSGFTVAEAGEQSEWVVYHAGTRERKKLQAPTPRRVEGERNTWKVVFDNEGYGILESQSGEEIDVDDILTKALYEAIDPPRELFIVEAETQKQTSWSSRLLKHRHGVARVAVGAAGGKADIHVACFDVPRGAGVSRCFFSLWDIYDGLGLEQWRSRCGRGRWVQDRYSRMAGWMEGLDIPGTLQKALPIQLKEPVPLRNVKEGAYEEGEGAEAGEEDEVVVLPAAAGPVLWPTVEKDEGVDEALVLPFPAVDTMAYLTFVATAAWGSNRLGGAKPPEPFREKLEGLLRCLHGQEWTMGLWVCSDVAFRWPAAPAGSVSNHGSLRVRDVLSFRALIRPRLP